MIEILQAEESAHSTMQQIQDYQKRPTTSIHYQSYNSRSKKSKTPSNEQNSSSSPTGSSPTGSKRKCFRCGAPYSRKHLGECRAREVTCNGCGIKGHLKKCCKKSGNFPKDNSNRQNQSPSTGPGRMNIASTLPQLQADFFDEKGLLKEYKPSVHFDEKLQQHQQQQQYQQTGGMFALRKIPITSSTPSSVSESVSDPAPDPVPTPDFPFQEFPLTKVVNQSQIDYSSLPDMLDPRENSNSSRKATKSTDLPLKSGLNNRSHEEMRENRDFTVSDKHTQSSRDSNTISISDNSTTRESITGITPGIMADTPSTPSAPSTFPVETDVTETPEAQLSNNRSVIPTDIQALTVLQSLVSDDFQAKNTHSTQRKGEDTPDTRPDTPSTQRKGEDETFQLIQKIHNQLQQVQWDLQRLHSLHKYKN